MNQLLYNSIGYADKFMLNISFIHLLIDHLGAQQRPCQGFGDFEKIEKVNSGAILVVFLCV